MELILKNSNHSKNMELILKNIDHSENMELVLKNSGHSITTCSNTKERKPSTTEKKKPSSLSPTNFPRD